MRVDGDIGGVGLISPMTQSLEQNNGKNAKRITMNYITFD